MDLSEYFRRIGFSGHVEKPDLATLKLLHKLHVMSIPFENLSLHCGEEISMDPAQVWDKIVRRGRGGWCFENGALFLRVLTELGYTTVALGSRVYSIQHGDYNTFDNHLIGKVEVEGRNFIVDVSFGFSKQILEPLELESGKEQSQTPGVFRLAQMGDTWELEKISRGPKVLDTGFEKSGLAQAYLSRPVYRFTLTPRSFEFFTENNVKLQKEPTSMFVNKSIISLQSEGEVKMLVGRVYTHITYEPDLGQDLLEVREVQDEELEKILRENFNVRLKNKLQPMDRKMLYLQ